MSFPFDEDLIDEFEGFVTLCKNQPQILNHPRVQFFKEYLQSLGVTIPAPTSGTAPSASYGDAGNNNEGPKNSSSSDEADDPESDIELNMEGVIESVPVDETQEMGNPEKEPTDEERDLSDEKRAEAMGAFSEQKFDEAIKLYTEAIQLNPQSALLFAKRGQVYLKLNKLLSSIKDCTRALELNCDSAAAYKFRGRAYRLLGKFEEASHDLCESLKIDYDDQTNEWLNEVKPNAEKLRQHRLGAQRRKEEKEHREKLRRARKAQEARARAAKAQAEAASAGMGGFPGGMGGFPGGMGGGFPGGMGGFPGGMPGGMPGARTGAPPSAGGFNPQDFASLLQDPEIMAAFQDPEIAAAFQDVSSNPANFAKYQNNPKISAVIEKLQAKFGKGGGGGGFPGGFPGGFGGAPNPGSKPSDDDVGLD